MNNLLNGSFMTPNGYVKTEKNGALTLGAKRPLIGEKFLPSNPFYTYSLSCPTALDEYIVLEYACFGLKRPQHLIRAPFMTAKNGTDTVTLVSFEDMTMDKNIHTVITKTPEGDLRDFQMGFYVDKVPEAYITISAFYTCKKEELPTACGGQSQTETPYTPIDLSDAYNGEYVFEDYDTVMDGGLFFTEENPSLYGIPFRINPRGNNLIAPPSPPRENDEVIENFGAKIKRRVCRPISRDSLTVIPIGKKAVEIYFVLTLSGKRYIRCLCGSSAEILGGSKYIDINEPLKFLDVEFFMIEVVYTDGRRDTNLPLHLGTNRHGISGDIGVYAIPCDGTVERVIIHNRNLDTDVNVAAVTVNETDVRRYPNMVIPEKSAVIQRDIGRERNVSLDGHILTLRNGAVAMTFDLSSGLDLVGFENGFTPSAEVAKGAVLKLRTADGEMIETFDLKEAKCSCDSANILYRYDGLLFEVRLSIEEENSVSFDLAVKNDSDETKKYGVLFPALPAVTFGGFSDDWYFVPKYQNLCSNETFFMYEESSPSFPMQFMDCFSPRQQGGISLLTRERELITRKYALKKDGEGISMYVEYPVMYGDLAAGGLFVCSPAALTCHSGDWRAAFDLYKGWLDSWYTPYRCQDKQWYRECFWLLAEITDFFETNDMCKFPCWYDAEKKEFRFRKILEEQKSITGVYPDILHMWSWCNTFRNGVYGQLWGNFGKEDYDKYGGVEAFRDALHDVRDNLGVQISLYMHPTLLSNCYPHFEKFFESSPVKSQSGGKISIYGDTYRMCHAEQSWRDYALAMYPRIYRELQIPLLYVDEFSLRIENRCYADNHGHRVPSSLLKTDRDFISHLKEQMPEEVVLYGEYAAADVNARYIDCNISYYILDSIAYLIETAKRAGDGDDTFSKVYIDTYRFAFPKIVQLILPMAMRNISWHPQKFLFFNAQAIYDSFWDNEESAGLDFTVKAYRLKKKYADCFTSDHPETMIETESPAICMNKFPAKDKTVYTVYNRAYTTFRGKALRVPHDPNNRYYDAWNERELDYRVQDGYAEIYLEIGAQEMGCLVIGS